MVEKQYFSIDFRHLETFCRVAALKSFSKAAEALYLTQPTVSGHILSLEKSLALRLFDRRGKEIRLTKAGQVLLNYASKILMARKGLVNALSEFAEGVKGEISLGASTIPGEYLLPKLMGDFRREHPGLTFSLKISDTRAIIEDLLRGNVELGLIGANMNRPPLQCEPFVEDEIIIVGPSGHPVSKKRKVELGELVGEPWITREEGSGTQLAVERALRRKGKRLTDFNVVAEMGSTSAVREAVKAGLGLAFISKRAVEEDLRRNLLVSIVPEGMGSIRRQIYTVFERGKTLSPGAIEFLRFLKNWKDRTN